MAKAQFHKSQKVFVRPVGTWAMIEKVMPQWTKGIDEPLRVFYDCGLGREFAADELDAQQSDFTEMENMENLPWRVVRARNRWQTAGDTSNHPHPGTYPVVVTADTDWGGWRVPTAEYDLYPEKVEQQAQIMSRSLDMMKLLLSFITYAKQHPEDLSDDMHDLAKKAVEMLEGERTS